MAYPYVSDSCMDEEHNCTGHENTPTDPKVCGGGFCICPCHRGLTEPPNKLWYDEVRAYSEERRRRGKVE